LVSNIQVESHNHPQGGKRQMSEIFYMEFPGNTGHPQEGEWMVCATNLKPSGGGGGWVASFEEHDEALRCRQIILGINRLHAPTILPILKN